MSTASRRYIRERFVFVVSEVRGHALHEPLWSGGRVGPKEVALKKNLELEDVGQLVLDRLLEKLVRQVDRQDHAVARRKGERADALLDEVGFRVRLLELGVGRIDDQRNRLRNLEVQGP